MVFHSVPIFTLAVLPPLLTNNRRFILIFINCLQSLLAFLNKMAQKITEESVWNTNIVVLLHWSSQAALLLWGSCPSPSWHSQAPWCWSSPLRPRQTRWTPASTRRSAPRSASLPCVKLEVDWWWWGGWHPPSGRGLVAEQREKRRCSWSGKWNSHRWQGKLTKPLFLILVAGFHFKHPLIDIISILMVNIRIACREISFLPPVSCRDIAATKMFLEAGISQLLYWEWAEWEKVWSRLSAHLQPFFLAHSAYFNNFRQKIPYFDASQQKRVLFNCYATKQC